MIDERSRRREGFSEDASTPVVMSDGQVWYLPRPYLAMTPLFVGGRPEGLARHLSYGPGLDELLQAIAAAESDAAFVLAAVGLGASLLLHNYDLSDEELSGVLVYRSGDPDSLQLIEGVVEVATGGLVRVGGLGALHDPKAASGGSASA